MGEEIEPVENIDGYSIKQLILYKMDRTFAVLGIILLGAWAISKGGDMPAPAIQITTGAVTALATYIGGRAASK
jgi:hypothetical protein